MHVESNCILPKTRSLNAKVYSCFVMENIRLNVLYVNEELNSKTVLSPVPK